MGQIVGIAELPALQWSWRRAGRRIVFTNGCFDLLHVGHLRSLRQARRLGGVLVVGLNDDDSVRRLKGPGRPLVPAPERAELLAALDPVDVVTIFSGETARELIVLLRPDIYAKGDDYAGRIGLVGKPLPEAELVRRHGGEVVILPRIPGWSTSALLARARADRDGE